MILSIDPSFRNIGYSLWEGHKLISMGIIKSRKKDNENVYKTLMDMLKEFSNLLGKNKNIEAIYMEELVGSKSSQALKLMALIHGGIFGIAASRNLKLYTINNRRAKNIVFGTDLISKDEVMRWAQHLLNIESIKKSTFEHIADSILVYKAIKFLLELEDEKEFLSRVRVYR